MNLFCNITKWGIAMAACAAMAACGSDEPSPTGGEEKGELRLLVSVPDRATRAIGDPGDEPQEADMWDRVSVIATFPGGQEVEREVYIKSFDRADYEQLPPYNGNEKIRVVTMDVSEGDAYIYGVTYNTAVDGNNLEKAIQACTTDAEVRALTIGNDYADGMQYSLPLKLSVATGYYKDADGKQATFNTRKGASTGLPEGELPVVRLTRLASKFDVQWDAADAYAQGYTDVEVTGFEFEGTSAGRLFPALNANSAALTPQTLTFVNDTEISRRNGRVYHYAYPDGVTRPQLHFNISAASADGRKEADYALAFKDAPAQASWYKVNVTIRGLSASGSYTIQLEEN